MVQGRAARDHEAGMKLARSPRGTLEGNLRLLGESLSCAADCSPIFQFDFECISEGHPPQSSYQITDSFVDCFASGFYGTLAPQTHSTSETRWRNSGVPRIFEFPFLLRLLVTRETAKHPRVD